MVFFELQYCHAYERRNVGCVYFVGLGQLLRRKPLKKFDVLQ